MKQFKYAIKICAILFSLSKKLFVLTVMKIIFRTIQPIVSIILSARIIQQLIDKQEWKTIIYTVVFLAGFNLVVGIINSLLESRINILNDIIKDDFCLLVGQKIMKLPYEKLEDPELLDLKQQSLVPIIQWGNFEFILNEAIPQIFGSILTIIATIPIVVKNNPLLLIPICVISVLCMFLANVRQRSFNEIMMGVGLIERKMNYFTQLAVDFSAGKEI